MNVGAGLALLSGVCWGAGDFIGGLQARRIGAIALVVWAQLISGSLLWTGLLLFAERGPQAELIPWALVAGAWGGVGITFFYKALAMGAMSLVAPVAACGVVVPVVVSLLLGEQTSALALAGIALAIVGVVLVSLPPRAEHHERMTAGVLALALASALGFAGFFVFTDQAAGDTTLDALWATAFVRAGSLTLMIPLGLRVARGIPKLHGRFKWVALAGVLDTSANGLFAIAATTGTLAVTSVLSSLYPAMTVLLAWVFLRERIGAVQIVGVAAALAGVVAIAAG